jgi:hypothetical protein
VSVALGNKRPTLLASVERALWRSIISIVTGSTGFQEFSNFFEEFQGIEEQFGEVEKELDWFSPERKYFSILGLRITIMVHFSGIVIRSIQASTDEPIPPIASTSTPSLPPQNDNANQGASSAPSPPPQQDDATNGSTSTPNPATQPPADGQGMFLDEHQDAEREEGEPLQQKDTTTTTTTTTKHAKGKARKKAVQKYHEDVEPSKQDDEPAQDENKSEDSSDNEDAGPIFQRTRSQLKAAAKIKDKDEDAAAVKAKVMQVVRKGAKVDVVEVLPPQRIYIDLTGDVCFPLNTAMLMLMLTPQDDEEGPDFSSLPLPEVSKYNVLWGLIYSYHFS